ncbi:triose-phosphate isomerase (plasmid) [Burkholderia sp. KK1]|nr:triose-phosphate isomerase [Burkholderia sp. KK1]
MRQKLILGNWKMHGSIDSNAALLARLAEHARSMHGEVDIGVCVPALFLWQARNALQDVPVSWGVQDVSAHLQGAFTGEISAPMVAEFGSTYAIVGHSERRMYHAEGASTVGSKAWQAIHAGLVPVVCVGETEEQRDAGLTDEVVRAQLDAVLEAMPLEDAESIVLAYEPVWAIGTGRSATAEQAQAVHAALRSHLREHGVNLTNVRILYGGSIKPCNAAELFECPDIDGGLIGGASLSSDDFISIIESARRVGHSVARTDEVSDAGIRS